MSRMKNKYVDIYCFNTGISEKKLEENYIRYICGFEKESKYHPQEIEGIKRLLDILEFDETQSRNFLYGYIVPQLGKEFDLLKVSNGKCVDIELKSESVSLEKIEKQLIQNYHYLRLISDNVHLFTFVSSDESFYEYSNGEFILSSADRIKEALNGFEGEQLDLDLYFTPKNILVSPLNSPEKFIEGKYLLTDQQQKIKTDILNYIDNYGSERFFGLTGAAGTGKTLLVYDIAKELAAYRKVLIVHSGLMCSGHVYISRHFPNIKILEAKELRYREIKDVDVVIIDEAHRLYGSIFEKAVRWTKRAKSICIFSFDPAQKMSFSENRRNTDEAIKQICEGNIAELKGKIRTNKNIATFIKCLFDMSKKRGNISFEGITILFEHDERKAVELALKQKSINEYEYISYTPSSFNSALDYQKQGINTHHVIGQEYDNVVMILNKYFEYDGDILSAKPHPNPDYMFPKLLFQGLTRARSKVCLIVTKEDLLKKILTLFD